MALKSITLDRCLDAGGERRLSGIIADYLSLMKPNIMVACMLSTAGGLWGFSGEAPTVLFIATLLGTGLTVGSASALNMVIERKRDGLMARTSSRPIPSGRVSPATAFLFAAFCGLAGIGLLALTVNLLTALLSLTALLIYVLIYTPLKGVSPLAFVVGLLPGAIPALMGWTAGAGSIDVPGLSFFFILLLWQVPHTVAISICIEPDYSRSGIRSFPGAFGIRASILLILVTTALMLPISLLPVLLNGAGMVYLWAAVALSLWLTARAFRGLHTESETSWARRYFMGSQIYLAALISAFIIETFF